MPRLPDPPSPPPLPSPRGPIQFVRKLLRNAKQGVREATTELRDTVKEIKERPEDK